MCLRFHSVSFGRGLVTRQDIRPVAQFCLCVLSQTDILKLGHSSVDDNLGTKVKTTRVN